MHVNINRMPPSPEHGPSLDDPIESVTLAHLTRDEMATIWFSLVEYRKNLHKTLDEVAAAKVSGEEVISDGLEDEAFCYEQLSKIANMQYVLRWDALPEDYTKWLDV